MNAQLVHLLEVYYLHHNQSGFIADDPISIPHQFSKKEDIEIAGLLTAILSWGQRKTIINKSKELIQRMDNAPYQFVTQAGEKDFLQVESFKHRTFNGVDAMTLLMGLKNIYAQEEGLEALFTRGFAEGGAFRAIELLSETLFPNPHLPRTRKHLARPSKGSAAKRINMFLRWMVRKDSFGVDFGMWHGISPSQLICPLDLHSGNTARKAGLLVRPQNDWQAAVELTQQLKAIDANDPVRFDFALFGIGVSKQPFPYF